MRTKEKRMYDVYRQIDKANMVKAYALIEPLLKSGDPEAQYVYAMYIAHKGETAEDYDLRSLKYMRMAAEQLYPSALYELGKRYQIGEGLPADGHQASELFKLAAERGHGTAKLSYAFYLYLGCDGVTRDRERARALVAECARDGVEGAEELMQRWKEEQLTE